MKNKKEELLIKIIHFLSEKLKENIVLEGGMLLRMFNSPRSTQDVDYYLISKDSKKVLAKDIKHLFESFEAATIVSVDLNSRGIFIDMDGVDSAAGRVTVEINVVPEMNLPTDHVSTVAVSNQYSLTGRVVATIALPEAFSHKIAASIERESMRDLYDISILEPLCNFDLKTLLKRFDNVSIKRKKSKKISPETAADILETRVRNLDEDKLQDELYPLIPPEQQAGLEYLIKASVMRVVQRLRGMENG